MILWKSDIGYRDGTKLSRGTSSWHLWEPLGFRGITPVHPTVLRSSGTRQRRNIPPSRAVLRSSVVLFCGAVCHAVQVGFICLVCGLNPAVWPSSNLPSSTPQYFHGTNKLFFFFRFDVRYVVPWGAKRVSRFFFLTVNNRYFPLDLVSRTDHLLSSSARDICSYRSRCQNSGASCNKFWLEMQVTLCSKAVVRVLHTRVVKSLTLG